MPSNDISHINFSNICKVEIQEQNEIVLATATSAAAPELTKSTLMVKIIIILKYRTTLKTFRDWKYISKVDGTKMRNAYFRTDISGKNY